MNEQTITIYAKKEKRKWVAYIGAFRVCLSHHKTYLDLKYDMARHYLYYNIIFKQND